MNPISTELNRYRAASGINAAVQVKRGEFQLVQVAYGKRGGSTITPISPYVSAPKMLSMLRELNQSFA